MKNKIMYILVICLVTIVFLFFVFNYYIKSVNSAEILTKNDLFDIIDSIEDVVITCIATDGDRHISEENKLDSTVLYLIKYKEKYKDYIISDLSEEKSIDKIEVSLFEKITKNIFQDVNFSSNDYKNYKDNYIELNYEPCNYFIYDNKEVISNNIIKNSYEIIIKYERNLNSKKNKVYVKYKFNLNSKIQDITILSSIIN